MDTTDDRLQALHDAGKTGHASLDKVVNNTKNLQTIINAPILVTDGIKEDETTTLLCEASKKWTWECVEILVRNGADINLTGSSGDTPLQCACRTNVGTRYKITQLLESRADVTKVDNLGNNVVHTASSNGNVDALELILDVLDSSVKHSVINSRNSDGYTPLSAAALTRHTKCITLLKRHEADISVGNANGYTPTMLAARWNHATCIVALLKDEICDAWQTCDSSGDTALHYAVRYDAFDAVQVLVGQGARVNIPNNDKITPLSLAKPHTPIKAFLEDKTQHTADIVQRYPLQHLTGSQQNRTDRLSDTLEAINESTTHRIVEGSQTDGPAPPHTMPRRTAMKERLTPGTLRRNPSMPSYPAPPPPKQRSTAAKDVVDRPTLSGDTDTFPKQLAQSGLTETDPDTLLKSQEGFAAIHSRDIAANVNRSEKPVIKPRRPRSPIEHGESVSSFESRLTVDHSETKAVRNTSTLPAPQALPRQYPVQHPRSRTLPIYPSSLFGPLTTTIGNTQSAHGINTQNEDLIQTLSIQIEQLKNDQYNQASIQAEERRRRDRQLYTLQTRLEELINQVARAGLQPMVDPNVTAVCPQCQGCVAAAVQSLFTQLIGIDASTHLPHLFSKSIVTMKDIEILNSIPIATEKTTKLLWTLFAKQTKWGPVFVDSLLKSEEEGDKILGSKICDNAARTHQHKIAEDGNKDH